MNFMVQNFVLMEKNLRKKLNKYVEALSSRGDQCICLFFQVKESDVIDLVMSRIEGAKYVSKRIIVYKVFPDRSMKNKVKVCLISWRQGIEVDGSQWN